MAKSNNPLSPLQPIPYRQPSYSDAQRLFSPPPAAATQVGTADVPAEEDDGGWTVDKDQSSYIAQVKRRKARSINFGSTSFGMYGSSADWEPVSNFTPPADDEVKAPSIDHADSTSGGKEDVPQQEVQAAEPEISVQAPTPSSGSVPSLAALLQAQGGSIDVETLARIKALLDERKPSTPPPPPSLPSPPPGQHLTPSPQTHDPVGSQEIGQAYPGRHGPVPGARVTGRDPNRLPLPVTRSWGAPSPSPPRAEPEGSLTPTPQMPDPPAPPPQDLLQAVLAAEETSSDGGWAPHKMVRDWAKGVQPETPPPTGPATPPPPSLTNSVVSTPNDIAEGGLEVSDGGSVDTDLPTPGKRDSPPPSAEAEVEVEVPSPIAAPPAPSTSRTDDRRTHESADGEDRRPLQPGRRPWERSDVKWKRAPHPAYSTVFARRRILIRFPTPVHKIDAKMSIIEHFGQYGSIRMTWFHDPFGRHCQDYVLIFDEEEAVERCVSDPAHTTLTVKSEYRPTEIFEVSVCLAPKYLTTRTIFVKITGPRSERSRSASPDRSESRASRTSRRDTREDKEWIYRPVPRSIKIDGVPSRREYRDRPEYWARIRDERMSFESVERLAHKETQWRSFHITTMDLGPRIPEKDIIPKLCDYFADIIEIVPPATKDDGWLIGVAGAPDGANVLEELSKIPGILARWAVAADGPLRREGPSVPELIHGSQRSRSISTAGVQDAQPEVQRQPTPPVGDGPDVVSSAISEISAIEAAAVEPAVDEPVPSFVASVASIASLASPTPPTSPPAPAPRSSSPTLHAREPTPPQIQTPAPPVEIYDPRYPHLRKLLIPTYRGRTLRAEQSDDATRFYDDAAVFVGRLVKGQETEFSLFERFSRYGQISQIEFAPKLAQSTYATARILYGSSAAADRAMQYEHNAVSFGSMLKVEKRRVLPNDVQMLEKYIDDFGRAYSPSMASQYSPPQRPMEDEMLFVQPPPLITGPAPGPPFMPQQQGLQWMPFPPPPMPPLHGSPSQEFHSSPVQPHGLAPMADMGQQGLVPLMYAMGIGYPPAGYTGHPSPNTTTGPLPATPPITPHFTLFPLGIPPVQPTSPPSAHPPSPPSALDTPLVSADPTPNGSSVDPNSGPTRSLTSIGQKYENGVLKVEYDEDALRRFRQERGIPEPVHKPKVDRAEEEGRAKAEDSDVASASIGPSPTTLLMGFQPPSVDIPYRSPEQPYHQRLHDLPIPFTPPMPHQDHSRARYSPESLLRPFNPRMSSPHGEGYPSSIDYGEQGPAESQGRGRPGQGVPNHGQAQEMYENVGRAREWQGRDGYRGGDHGERGDRGQMGRNGYHH